MNKKLLTVLFCLGFSTIAFSQDIPIAIDVEESTINEEGEFTDVIPVDPEDWLQPHEFPVDPIPEIIIDEEEEEMQFEEQELGGFTDGILVGPGDFLIPPFIEDAAAPGELVFSEEETELGEFTGGILINNNDSLVIEYEEELDAPVVVEEAELVIGEFYNGESETEMNIDVEVLNDGFLAL